MYNITIIVAMDRKRAIGKRGNIPWRLSRDMKHFVDTTMGHPVVMGRKTYVSLPEKFKPLPGRENFVLSRNLSLLLPGCKVLNHIETILMMSLRREIFIIGGAEIYAMFLPHTKRLLVTQVETVIEDADTFFPIFTGKWCVRSILVQEANEKNDFAFFITEYNKVVR